MTDPIADMIIRIKNAQAAGKNAVAFDYSKIKYQIAKLLETAGFIGAVDNKGKKDRRVIEAVLLYDAEGSPKISSMKRISKASKRIYRGYKEIFPVKKGLGLAIYSTPKGLMTDKEARKAKVGGEAILEVW